MQVNIVWLKRDIRWRDQEALHAAIETGKPLIIIYFFEPELIANHDAAPRHWRFVYQSIADLNRTIFNQTGFEKAVQMAYCDVLTGFEIISQRYAISQVYSYQESGNALSYRRDKIMKKWFSDKNIEWIEMQTNGVQRGRKNRQDWSLQFDERMAEPEVFPDLKKARFIALPNQLLETLQGNSLEKEIVSSHENFQPGGEKWAWRYLNSFLNNRVKNYSKGISKPEESRSSCSRLSPYLAWGNISMRSLFQEMKRNYATIPNKRALSNWRSRLYWHCHFIQKFEMESRYEFENINRAFDLLPHKKNDNHIQAWQSGQTGFPLVDACMRCVVATGYLNFRMRAMVVSFLTHNLLQPWQSGASFLAKQFLDYEPGIHFPQFQMQAGTTGTNTLRIYNVVKQAEEHDPEAVFIKKWVPELEKLPAHFAIKPWEMTPLEQVMYGFSYGKDYPLRIVDHEETARTAKVNWAKIMKTEIAKSEAKRILHTHVHLSDKRAHRSKSDIELKTKLRNDA